VTTATPAQLALAYWLIGRELDDGGKVLPVSEAAERACRKFGNRLALLVTPAGAEALLSRATHLARTNFPSFDQQRTARTVEALTERLRQTSNGVHTDQVDEGMSAVFASLIALVMSFVGEDLTWRMLREVWPELPVIQSTRQTSNSTVEATP
jgi:hypothetical protein